MEGVALQTIASEVFAGVADARWPLPNSGKADEKKKCGGTNRMLYACTNVSHLSLSPATMHPFSSGVLFDCPIGQCGAHVTLPRSHVRANSSCISTCTHSILEPTVIIWF